MFGQIIVAYDGSPGAIDALRAAVDLAQVREVNLTAVVVEAHLPRYAATVGEMDEERDAEERDARRWSIEAEAYSAERKLQQLGKRSGVRVTDLVGQLRLPANTVRALVGCRTEAGLLQREEDGGDRRVVVLELTEPGRS